MSGLTILCTFLCAVVFRDVSGHGRLLDPPSRSTMFRAGFDTPENYNDNQLYCGGFWNQKQHGGKCGVCGDPYQGPRDNEAGGKYATGIISETLARGQSFPITVEITANHLGWFEFRICPVNNYKVKVTQECLDQNLLELADDSGTRYPLGTRRGKLVIEVKLPADLTCTQCVLQWKYHTGNNWGLGPDGVSCPGCGEQEEFYGCADVAITESGTPRTMPSPGVTTKPTKRKADVTTIGQTGDSCKIQTVTNIYDVWCTTNCRTGVCKQVYICV